MNRTLTLIASAGLIWAQAPTEPPADPKDRAKMVRDYARTGGEIAPIAPYVHDPDLNVQRTAVEGIVRLGGPESLTPLVEATRIVDEEIQARAVDGLVNFYVPGYLQTGISASIRRIGAGLKARFTDDNTTVVDPYVSVRPDVVEAIGRLASGGISLPVRASAARAVGILRGRAALPNLYEALRTKDSLVLYEALVAIRKIGDPAAGPEITFLVRDLDERVQIAAIEASGQLNNRGALPRLAELVRGDRGIKARRAALIAMAKMPDETYRPLHEMYLTDRDEGLRAGAAEGFARLGRAEDRAAMERYFEKEGKMEPRLSFALAAVMLGNHAISEFSPLQYLINTLNSASYRDVAAPFLEELCRDAGVRAAVMSAAPRMNREEKIQIAGILARTGGVEAEPILVAISQDSDATVARAGAMALRTLRSRPR
jgi:HEAT repeat protein